jgi:AP endonuclease-2
MCCTAPGSRTGSLTPNVEDVMNPANSPKDLLPTSARLIPEFNRRRSIRDMFVKKATPSSKVDSKVYYA